MAGFRLRTMLNLKSASAAVTNDFVTMRFLNTAKELFANLHGDCVFIALEAVVAAHAATAGIGLLHGDTGNLRQNLGGGNTEALTL